VIENTEKVDTCQLEIQKRGHLWKDRSNWPEERTIFWCFALKFLDRLLLSLSQAESSEKWCGLRWVGEDLFSPINLVKSCAIRRFPRAADLLTAANWVETSDRLGLSDVFR
jgi:hypothetical protein